LPTSASIHPPFLTQHPPLSPLPRPHSILIILNSREGEEPGEEEEEEEPDLEHLDGEPFLCDHCEYRTYVWKKFRKKKSKFYFMKICSILALVL
jgi:hypothetical protein